MAGLAGITSGRGVNAEGILGLYYALDNNVPPDGVADASTPLTNLIAALPAAGGTLVLGPGTYLLNNSVTVPTGVTLWILQGVTLAGAGAFAVTGTGAIVDFRAGLTITGLQTFSGGGNGQLLGIQSLTEVTTIAAAATSVTTLQIPAGAIVLGVPVRVTTVIPTAATFTVIGNTTTTVFNTAAVAVAAGSTDPGTAAGAFVNTAAQTIRITPNLTPGAATGRVRVTVFFISVTPPVS